VPNNFITAIHVFFLPAKIFHLKNFTFYYLLFPHAANYMPHCLPTINLAFLFALLIFSLQQTTIAKLQKLYMYHKKKEEDEMEISTN